MSRRAYMHAAFATLILAALVVVASLAFAGDAPPKVPTGYEVRGATYYILNDGKVVQVDPSGTRHAKLFWIVKDREGHGGNNDAGAGSQ